MEENVRVEVVIREATAKDVEQVVVIEEKSFSDAWSKAIFQAELVLPYTMFLVAEIEGLVAGYIIVEDIASELNIMNIAVLDDFRKLGIGGMLVEAILSYGKKNKVLGVTLECRVSNTAAVALYKKMGFHIEGVRKGYYSDGEDAYIMWVKKKKITLAVETSCDETSCAVLRGENELLANEVYSQIDVHKLFGGVVPEIASRNHLMKISEIVESAVSKAGISYDEIDLVAVTRGPGLVGALLVGLTYTKALAYALDKRFIGIHHIEGHIAANYLSSPELKPPFLCLVVSGGHTHLVDVRGYTEFKVLGRTMDDAVGEAYDKVARVLGLGYPGGPKIDRLAKEGRGTIEFPKAKMDGLDFSFSGLKTAVLNYINSAKQRGEELNIPDICASFQEAVVSALYEKTKKAVEQTGYKSFALAGGVAANSRIREALHFEGVKSYYPPISLCTDNAAMIAAAAYHYDEAGYSSPLSVNASPSIKIGESFAEQG